MRNIFISRTIISLILICFTATSIAQYTNVQISSTGASVSEPSICINPQNPDQLVAGSNLNKYYISEDGGYTWSMNSLSSPQYGVWGDPVIIVDTAGDFYFFHLSNPAVGNWIDRIVCQKYNWEQSTWSDGTYMGLNGTKAQDKEWAVVDSATNTIHVTWTQFDEYGTSNPNKFSNIHYSKSTDAGETWSEAVQINEVSGNCVDSDETTEGAVPTMGPDGEIYVAWSGPEGIVFDKSIDGGNTWLDEDIFINSQPGGWDYNISGIYRANGLPITCCDISNSPNRGTIYVNWTDQRNGEDDSDVWLAKSTDGGNTWSDAIRVNDDHIGNQQFFSWMTIDQKTGELLFVFYDRRHYDDTQTDVYMARSSDGGETFENIRISDSPFLPNSNVFFGDYTNITAYNGIVRPIWARADGMNMSIWTAIVDPTTGFNEPLIVAPISLEQNYPNPFTESTYLAYKVRRTSAVTLKVRDIYGRTIATLINNEFMSPGKYTERFESEKYDLPSGVYYYTLHVGNFSEKQKMILLD